MTSCEKSSDPNGSLDEKVDRLAHCGPLGGTTRWIAGADEVCPCRQENNQQNNVATTGKDWQ